MVNAKKRVRPLKRPNKSLIKDKLYNEIILALDGEMVADTFELAAVALLEKNCPGIAPVHGGSDGGMDGEIPDLSSGNPMPLICTTSREGMATNIAKNLKSFLKNGGRSRRAVFATPRSVTPMNKLKLKEAAEKLGFQLVVIYDQEFFADALYRNSFWRKALLNIPGSPSVLSEIPRGRRGQYSGRLVGREKILERIRSSESDLIVLGQPGSGKTRLLTELTGDKALFVISADSLDELADEIREKRPKTIIIDDAIICSDFTVELLERLIQMRVANEFEFHIIASSWPGAVVELKQVLDAGPNQVITIEMLTRSKIVELAKDLGISGPNDLLRILATQAQGRPGLLVTLAEMVIRGDIDAVVKGEILVEKCNGYIKRLIGKDASLILGVLAISGEAGFDAVSAGKLLGQSASDIQNQLAELDMAGLIKTITGFDGKTRIVVTPAPLRWVLIRDVFYRGVRVLDAEEIIAKVPNHNLATLELIGAYSRGAKIPNILHHLEKCEAQAWKNYASLGEDEALEFIRRRPDLISSTLQTLLLSAPKATIPHALNGTDGKNRNLHSNPDHPLRQLQDWVRDMHNYRQDPIQRRTILLDSALANIRSYGQNSANLRAVFMAFDPLVFGNELDPGDGVTMTIFQGILGGKSLEKLFSLWIKLDNEIDWNGAIPWFALLELLHSWVYGSDHVSETPENENIRKHLAERLLRKVGERAENPGLRQAINHLAEYLEIDLVLTINRDYTDLFPSPHYDNIEEFQAQNQNRVNAFLARHKDLDPSKMSDLLIVLDAEAASVGHAWPKLTREACLMLANTTQTALSWVSELVDKSAPSELIEPFLRSAAEIDASGWELQVSQLLDKQEYRFISADILLSKTKIEKNILEKVSRIEGAAQLINQNCMAGRVSRDNLLYLLKLKDEKIVAATVEGHWSFSRKKGIEDILMPIWRNAVLRIRTGDRWLKEILSTDSDLASAWIDARLSEDGKGERMPFETGQTMASLISPLSASARTDLLVQTKEDSGLAHYTIPALIGDDVDMYKRLLERDDLKYYWLCPLEGNPNGSWIAKALSALEAGLDPKNIALSCIGNGWSYMGKVSDLWRSWIQRFDKLGNQDDTRLQEIAKYGKEHFQKKLDLALEEEREEAVFGRL